MRSIHQNSDHHRLRHVAESLSPSSLSPQTVTQIRTRQRPAAPSPPPVTKHIEDIIDEKCRILNKNGTPKGGALHLAHWMKCQFDTQQQKHRNLMNAVMNGRGGPIVELVETETGSFRSDTMGSQADINMDTESEEKDTDDERIEDWTVEQVRKRSRELKLLDGTGHQMTLKSASSSQVTHDELMTDDGDEEHRSKSPSRSTTSDSQITVRSSPIITSNVVDSTISMCRQCHHNCKSSGSVISHVHQNQSGISQNERSAPNVHPKCCQSKAYSNSSGDTTNKPPSSSFTDSAVMSSSEKCDHTSTKSTAKGSPFSSRAMTESPMYLQLNGSCTTISSSVITTTTPSILSSQSPKRQVTQVKSRPGFCQCRCSPRDFIRATVGSDEIQQETCKLIENVHEVRHVHETGYVRSVVLPAEIKLPCTCETTEDTADPFDAVPSIAIVPPTPEGKLQSLHSKDSPDSNESGQCEEPPYTVFTSGLRRFGTMSSLEKVPSDERFDSSDEEDEQEAPKKTKSQMVSPEPSDNHEVDQNTDEDIRVVTKKVYSDGDDQANASLRNWTVRAGSYMADKISFFEESRAFFDKYMGRWERGPNEEAATGAITEGGGEECTSGATSGEDVWGTPSSGGENDEMQMFNSDQTQSVSIDSAVVMMYRVQVVDI